MTYLQGKSLQRFLCLKVGDPLWLLDYNGQPTNYQPQNGEARASAARKLVGNEELPGKLFT